MLSALATAAVVTLASAQPVTTYGSSAAGTGGVHPLGFVRGEFTLASASFVWTLERARGGSATVLALAAASARIPVSGVTLLVDPTTLVALGPLLTNGTSGGAGTGSASLPMPIPAATRLLGAALFAQWFVADPAAPSGLAATDGVRATLRESPAILAALDVGMETLTATSSVAPWLGVDGADLALCADGTTAVVRIAPLGRVDLYDTVSRPPLRIGPLVLGSLSARWVAVHPHVPLAYVAALDTATSMGGIGVFDLDRRSATFATRIAWIAAASPILERPAMAADGTTMVVSSLRGSQSGLIQIVDVDPRSPTRHLVVHSYTRRDAPESVALSGRGDIVYSIPSTGGVRRLDARTGALLQTLSPATALWDPRLEPRGRWLVAMRTGGDGFAVVDLAADGSMLGLRPVVTGPIRSVAAMALSSDGSEVTLGTAQGYETYDLATGSLVQRRPAASGTVLAIVRR